MFFIPVFAKYMAEKNEEEGWHVYSTIITCMGLILLALIVIGEIFAPHIVRLLAPGFDAAQQTRVVFLTRLMLPSQLFLFLASMMGSVAKPEIKVLGSCARLWCL